MKACRQPCFDDMAMYMAAREGQTHDIDRIASCSPTHINKSVLLEWTDDEGRTPLIISIENGHESTALKLLQHGADVHACSNRGTVLLAALESENLNLVDILLERGASPFLKTAKGTSAWEYALVNCRSGGILREFERYASASGLLRFQVPVIKKLPNGRSTTYYSWRRLWTCVIPEYSVHPGHVFVRSLLYVFPHSTSFTPMCIAQLDDAQCQIVRQDRLGTTAAVDLPMMPYELKGIASINTVDSMALYVRELKIDDKFLMTFLGACGTESILSPSSNI